MVYNMIQEDFFKNGSEEVVEDLLQIVAEIEAYIDFPEEDLPAEGENAPGTKIEVLTDHIESLSETAQTGIFLREGVKAIIVGEPNAGFFLLY